MKYKGLLYCCLTALLMACTTDAYDKGEGKYSYLKTELVEAHVGSDKNVDFVVTDEGERLMAEPPFTAKWITTADTTYRALLLYDCKTDGKAACLSFGRINVLEPVVADSVKNGVKTDPVRYESSWVSTSRRYLNVAVYLVTGATDDSEMLHRLGMVADTLTVWPDSTRTLRLRLYHDQQTIPQYYSQRTYFSVPLYDIDADTVTLSVNTFDGIVERSFTVK